MNASRRPGPLAFMVGAAVIALAACGTDNNNAGASAPNTSASTSRGSASSAGCASGSLNAQGSTFQANMQTQWTKDYGAKCSGARVNYQGTGSGAGIQAISNGTADFAGSDVTMKNDEKAAAEKSCESSPVTLPVTAGGVAIVYNLPGVDSLKLSAETLAAIFQGEITKWDDAAIATENAGVSLPSKPISVFYRNDSSGTTAVFTQFLQTVAGSEWKLGSGKTIAFFPGAQGAKGSAGVAAAVNQTEGGVTYDEASYAKGQQLPVAAVRGAGGDFALPTTDAVSQAVESGFTAPHGRDDLAGTMDYAKMTTGYPISTVSYVIACSKYQDAAKAALVRGYLSYAVGYGQAAADALGYAPLPSDLAAKDQALLEAIS